MNLRYYAGPKRRAPKYLIMCAGCIAVFLGLLLINKSGLHMDETLGAAVVNFVVPIKPAVPPAPKPEQERKPVRMKRPTLAPVPRLEGSFSNLALSSPDFLTDREASVSDSLLGELEDVVMTEESVDTPPIPKNIRWEYPERAKQRGIEGSLVVALHISAEGFVLNSEIIEADPPGVFDDAVLAASKSWTFVPAKYEQKPVATWVNLPIEATLQ